jgi:Glycosyltransferase 61
MGALSFLYDYQRRFERVVVHETQSILDRANGFYRGGPDWPHFSTQIFARHCWGMAPRPFDSRPRPAELSLDIAEKGVWCGAVGNHFGHFVADFGMRLAASSLIDSQTPLIFSVQAGEVTTFFFWQIIDHFKIDRSRIKLISRPTRFDRLSVLPQAERRFGGGPSRRHLAMMDALTAPVARIERDLPAVYVSRARLPHGRFAGESYLDEALADAGVFIFHPEGVDLHVQFETYRRARRLIFSEGSAVHALQLLGHVEADVAVLTRRSFSRIASASLRPRALSLAYMRAMRGLIHGLNALGQPHRAGGVSVLDETRLLAAIARCGVNLTKSWSSRAFAERRDADLAQWLAHREALGAGTKERALVEKQMRALGLRV